MKVEAEVGLPCFKPLHRTPYSEKGRFTHVYEGVGYPDIVVKEIHSLLVLTSSIIPDFNYRLDKFRSHVVEIARTMLDNQYGLRAFVPDFVFVWGLNERAQKKGFIIMQKVYGQDIEDINVLTPSVSEQLDKLLAASLRVYKGSNNRITPDVLDRDGKPKNIRVGNVAGSNAEARPYLVDLYPAVSLYRERRVWEKAVEGMGERYNYNFPRAEEAVHEAYR